MLKFKLYNKGFVSPQELAKELQTLVCQYQNMSPDEKAESASNEDIGVCLFFCWNVLECLLNWEEDKTKF